MDRAELRRRIKQRSASVRHQELCRLFQAYGWEHARTTGSHYIYKKAGQRPFPIPCHSNAVPAFIVRNALALLAEEDDVGD